MRENFYDGAWRPVIDMAESALDRLRRYGFEFGADSHGHMMARWPVEPERPSKPALTFTGDPLAYWRTEVALHCAVSLARLRAIVAERGADYETTVAGLR